MLLLWGHLGSTDTVIKIDIGEDCIWSDVAGTRCLCKTEACKVLYRITDSPERKYPNRRTVRSCLG